jgi:hypothetical protein
MLPARRRLLASVHGKANSSFEIKLCMPCRWLRGLIQQEGDPRAAHEFKARPLGIEADKATE